MTKLIMFLVTLGLLLTCAPGVSHAADYNPLVSGHRGVKGFAGIPENTLAAFKYAKNSGADVIELDIQWTKGLPGEPYQMVVMHDATVDRTTNGTGYVRTIPWSKMKKLSAGNGQRVPLFEEVLKWAKANGLQVNSEIKGNMYASKPSPITSDISDRQAKRYIAMIEKYGMAKRNVMSSPSRKVIRKIQKNDTRGVIETALISYSSNSTDEAFSYGRSYMPTWKQVTRSEVASLRSKGVDTYIWPIKTKEDFERAYATKAAVLVADNPADVVQWLKEK